MQSLSIGRLAKAAGIGVETIRFYEREGLIPDPPRKRSGYRQYPPETLVRLQFIRRAKDLGFTLREIRELLELRVDADRDCAEVRAIAAAKVEEIDTKMEELQRIRAALVPLTTICRGAGPTSECPILDRLDGPGSEMEDEDV